MPTFDSIELKYPFISFQHASAFAKTYSIHYPFPYVRRVACEPYRKAAAARARAPHRAVSISGIVEEAFPVAGALVAAAVLAASDVLLATTTALVALVISISVLVATGRPLDSVWITTAVGTLSKVTT